MLNSGVGVVNANDNRCKHYDIITYVWTDINTAVWNAEDIAKGIRIKCCIHSVKLGWRIVLKLEDEKALRKTPFGGFK